MNPEDFRYSSTGKPIRSLQKYWVFIPNPLPYEISWSPKLISLLSEADRALARLAGVGANFPNPHAFAKPFIRREAVLSSQIEGTRATLEDVYKFEAVQLTFLKPDSDADEVFNYVKALDYGIQRLAELPISFFLLKEAHAILLAGKEPFTPGEFRRTQNFIGSPGSVLENAAYVPPPVEEMHTGLNQLEDFIHAEPEIPLLIRLGMVHYQFEAIHPFLDGNGRIGRLLIALLLHAWDLLPQPLLYLSVFFKAHQTKYYELLLNVSQTGDWESWLLFFLEGIRSQSLDAIARIQKLEEINLKHKILVEKERNAKRLNQALDFLVSQPIVTISQVQEGIGVSGYNNAMRIVQKLEKIGILREITGRARNRIYQADDIWEAIQGELPKGKD